MPETSAPKTTEALAQTLLTESAKKEWLNQPDGAWGRDLEVMEVILPAGILPLYQTLALDKQVHEKSGSQNRLHLATIAALTETGNPAVWTNKETAKEVMGAVRSALGDRYPNLLNEWDQGKGDTFSLLSAARLAVKELGYSQTEEKPVAGEPVTALMYQIDTLPASTQKRIQALMAAVLDNLDSQEDLETLQMELQKSGVNKEDIAAWHEGLIKQRAEVSVQAWEKMKAEGSGGVEKAGERLMRDLVIYLQKDLADPEKDPNYYSINRDWQTKAAYVRTWVGTTAKPGKLAALFGAGEEGVAKAQQAFETVWTNYLKGMELPDEVLKRLPQYGQKVVERAVIVVKEMFFDYRGDLKDRPSLELVRTELLGPKGFLEKALGNPTLAQVIFDQIKAKLLAPVEQIAEQGGEPFNALTKGGEKIARQFISDMADLIGQGKVTEAELLENPQLVRKYGQILTPEQRQQLIQKGLEAF